MAEVPTYWTWAPPLGEAASLPNYIPMVPTPQGRIITSGETGTQLADATTAAITLYGLEPGQVAITFNGWGNADRSPRLWRHPDDGIPGNSSQVPFYASGIAESQAWVKDYIDRYLANQAADPSIPDPTAVWLDYEERLFIASQFVTNWATMKADPRWESEQAFYGGQSWAQRLAEQGIGDPPDSGGNAAGANLGWSLKVGPLLMESMAWALDQALFGPMIEQWPNLKTSNWRTTHSGLHVETWGMYSARVGGTHQGVILYASSVAGLQSTWYDEMNPLYADRPYTPWVQFIGEGGVNSTTIDDYMALNITKAWELGVRDILVWGNQNGSMAQESNWDLWVKAAGRAERAARDRTSAQNKMPRIFWGSALG